MISKTYWTFLKIVTTNENYIVWIVSAINGGLVQTSFELIMAKFKPVDAENDPWSSHKLNPQFTLRNTWWTMPKTWNRMKTTYSVVSLSLQEVLGN